MKKIYLIEALCIHPCVDKRDGVVNILRVGEHVDGRMKGKWIFAPDSDSKRKTSALRRKLFCHSR